jgi:TRAP transporter TAXI family solute receptor
MEMPKNLLISLATGGAGGTYYVMGGGMPTIIEKAIPGSKLVVQSTAASTENARLVGKGDVEFGFNMPDGAYFATTGEREYAPTNEKYPKIKGVLAGHLSVCQAFTSKSSGITSFGQLKGKRISLSAPSSPSMYVSIAALEAYGLKEGDFSNAFMSYSEMADAVRNGSLDCGFSFGGIPTASALDLSMSIDTVIIGMEQDRAELAVKLFPYYSYGTIPANTYKGQTEDRIALTAPAIIITNDDVPENVVYYFTKALWENLDELKIIHPAFNEWVLEKAATGLGVPLHPGAERYYREVGVIE